MGYRTDVLLLRPAPAETDPELLGQFGYQGLLLNRDTAANGFFFLHPGCLLTARHPEWALFYADLANRYFHQDPPHQREAALRARYPDHRVLAISRSDTANFYLYNYGENGRRVRIKMGDHGNSVSLNIGEPLPEEQSYYERIEDRNQRLNSGLGSASFSLPILENHPAKKYQTRFTAA